MSSETSKWKLDENFTWESTQAEGERFQSIRPLHVIPVDKEEAAEASLVERVRMGMTELQDFVSGLYQNAVQRKGKGISIQNIPVQVLPSERLFMEDYKRVKLTGRYVYYRFGESSGTYSPSLSRDALQRIPNIGSNEWRFCAQTEAKNIFSAFKPNNWGSNNRDVNGSEITCLTILNSQYYYISANSCRGFDGSDRLYSVDIYVAPIPEKHSWLGCMLDWDWKPENATDALWNSLKELWQGKMIELNLSDSGEITLAQTPKLMDAARTGSLQKVGFVSIQGEIIASEELYETAKKKLLECDKHRADISPYEERQLDDPTRGSWELWEPDMERNLMLCIPSTNTPSTVYARDPRLDILDGGVIGIDFGTKSTVVVCLEESSRIRPLRIGRGSYEQKLDASDYENPTVMEFVNLARFMDAYSRRRGRPLTTWTDLPVSYTASKQWNSSQDTSHYFSFLGNLKQWAGDPKCNIHLRDQQGKEYSLPAYIHLHDSDPDPIELYAYYIGLYINNMHRGHIYMEYLLSFPVTYDKTVREHILASFRRGIMHSLPEAVLNDEQCAEKLSIRQGVGEPAAYAVCALKEYGFCPEEDEQIHYAVFDFGGGTTDFDFGIWKRAQKPARGRGRWDYVIRHFGDGGDRYLGGENLLEMLSFYVFRQHQDKLREKRITFPCPPHCEPFPGSDVLIADSQEAHSNMRIMMERLRPLWENTEGTYEDMKFGQFNLDLFSKDGSGQQEAVDFSISKDDLIELLRQRIAEGVGQFFAAMYKAFGKESILNGELGRIYIFLAGNSSRSPLLWEEFQKQIQLVGNEIRLSQAFGGDGSITASQPEKDDGAGQAIDETYFMLCPPLGTSAAQKKMEELGVSQDDDTYVERPNGKTGVAFGLVQCRDGSRIKVEQEIQLPDNEIPFRCWIGMDIDGSFEPILKRDTPYQKWVEYMDAGGRYFECWGSTLPTADQPGALPVSKARRFRLSIPEAAVNDSWMIYLRATGPLTIEYTVARSQEDADIGRYQCDPIEVKIEL